MTRDDITTDLINSIMCFQPSCNDEIIDIDTDIIKELEYDSIALIELINEIEEKFGVDFIELPDFAERFERIGDIVEGIMLLKERA